jgi:hypothetical protein
MKTLKPPSALTGTHLRTYERIFQHPLSHNLAWRDVLALFSHLGDVGMETNGHRKITRNGQVLVLPVANVKDVAEADELMKLRHFLEASEPGPAEPKQRPALVLVVIDHEKARVFPMEMNGAAPQLIVPYTTEEHFRQAHAARDYASGKENPAPHDFFEQIAAALRGAGEILLFGPGTGTSSEMEQFTHWLKKHHRDLAPQIIGTVAIDEHHLTEPQLEAKAKEFYHAQRTASHFPSTEASTPTAEGRVTPYGKESATSLALGNADGTWKFSAQEGGR